MSDEFFSEEMKRQRRLRETRQKTQLPPYMGPRTPHSQGIPQHLQPRPQPIRGPRPGPQQDPGLRFATDVRSHFDRLAAERRAANASKGRSGQSSSRPTPAGNPFGPRDWSAEGQPAMPAQANPFGPRDWSAPGQPSTSQTQTEPSVRPKVRPTSSQGGRSALERPEPQKVDYSPDSYLVQRYRHPTSRGPDFDAMKRSLPEGFPEQPPSDLLLKRNRDRLKKLRAHDNDKLERQVGELQDRGYYPHDVSDKSKNEKPVYRWRKASHEWPQMSQSRRRPNLVPRSALADDRRVSNVNKPTNQISHRPGIDVMPRGRQNIPVQSRSGRSMSMNDLSELEQFENNYPQYGSKEYEFYDRYRQLPKEEREDFKKFQGQISPNQGDNRLYRKRLTYTGTFKSIQDKDVETVNKIRSGMRVLKGQGSRRDRVNATLQKSKKSAVLEPHALPKDMRDAGNPPIREEDEDNGEEEAEEEQND